jgi:hypothetical protein
MICNIWSVQFRIHQGREKNISRSHHGSASNRTSDSCSTILRQQSLQAQTIRHRAVSTSTCNPIGCQLFEARKWIQKKMNVVQSGGYIQYIVLEDVIVIRFLIDCGLLSVATKVSQRVPRQKKPRCGPCMPRARIERATSAPLLVE